MMNLRLRALAMLALLGLLVSACGSGDSNDNSASRASSEATEGSARAPSGSGEDEVCTEDRVGGSLTLAALSVGATLDPMTVGGGSSATALEYLALYDTLVRYDESTGEFVPQLAESLEPNEDASEWTLTLRDGIEYGNGDPLDAEAVKVATDRYLTTEGSRMRSAAQFIESVDVVDPLTVKYVLTQPWGFFPVHLAAGGGSIGALGLIPNVKLIEERGVDAFGQDSSGGGAGPYEVKEWAPPERVVLEAKEDWWGGPVCIEELTFTPLPGGQPTLDSLRTGEVDMAIMQRDPVVDREAVAELDHMSSLFQSAFQLQFNHAHPEIGDVRVRRAMAAAIDPEVIDQRAWGGQGLPWSGLVHPDSALLDATDGPQYDPEAAKALVEELKAEGMDLSFELKTNDPPATVEAALAIEAMLEAAGFEIEVTPLPTGEFISAVNVDRNFELANSGQTGSEVTLFASLSRFNSADPSNPWAFKSPEFDDALLELQAAKELDELQAAVETVQEVWNDQLPAYAYGADLSYWVFRDGIQGVEYTRGTTPLFDTAYLEG